MKFRIGISLIQNNLDANTAWIAGFYYIKNCLNALMYLPDNQRPTVIIFVSEQFNEPILLPEFSENSDWLQLVKIPCDKNGYPIDLQKNINANPFDVLFPLKDLPGFSFAAPMIGWIPDFQHKYLPHFFSDNDLLDRNIIYDFILKNSNVTVCSSHCVADDIKQFYPELNNQVEVLQFKSIISNNVFIPDSQNILNKFKIDRKYILLPNQFWLHKNHKMVFEAWNQLKINHRDYLLVCTGASADYRNADYFADLQSYIKTNNLENMIYILGFIDRFEQIQLLRNAAAILQPSLFEGWNTSIEDAKALGKKLIISNIPVHKEQCGNNADYFDTNNAALLSNLITQIWSSLPDRLDPTYEQNAVQSYRNEIKTFAHNFLNILSTSLATHNQNMCARQLVFKLNSELQLVRLQASMQLDIINRLEQKLASYAKINKIFNCIKLLTPKFAINFLRRLT